jgi:hypothetical protein
MEKEEETTMVDNSQYSFQRGWYRLRQSEVAEARAKIMAMFGITTRMAFIKRLNGDTMGIPSDRDAIERVFAEYGIEKDKVWGKA